MLVNVCGVVSLQEIAARVEAAVTDRSKAGSPSFSCAAFFQSWICMDSHGFAGPWALLGALC